MAGPSIGFLLSAKFKSDGVSIDVKEDLESVDFGLGFGGGVVKPSGNMTLFAEAKYFLGLSNINKVEGESKISYRFNLDGLIYRQTYTPLPNQPSFQENMQPAIEWAKRNRTGELREIYREGHMSFNQEMGERWVSLLRQWHEAIEAG